MSPPRRGGRLRRYLVAGVLVWLPILATIWVVTFIVDLMDRTLVLVPVEYRPQALFGFPLPGVGVVFAFVLVLVTGLLVTNLVGRRLVMYWERLLQRIPLVRSVYGGVKGLTESVLSTNSSFRKVVAIQYPQLGIWCLGFITAEDLPELSERTGEQQVCIYMPTAPNPTSGYMFMVPRAQVMELEMSVDAAMKMVITCGVVVPPPVPQAAAPGAASLRHAQPLP